jgi:hypothetical protein
MLKSRVPALKELTEEPNPRVLPYAMYIFVVWIEEGCNSLSENVFFICGKRVMQ